MAEAAGRIVVKSAKSKLDFPKRRAALFIKPVLGIPEDDPAKGPSDARLLMDDLRSIVDRPKKKVSTTAVSTTAVSTTAVSTGNRHRPGYKTEYMREWRAKRKQGAK